MSIMTIVGLVLWALTLLFGTVKVNGEKIRNPLTRIIVLAIAFPLIGMIFTIVGLIGLVFLAPVLHFFGWEWSIKHLGE